MVKMQEQFLPSLSKGSSIDGECFDKLSTNQELSEIAFMPTYEYHCEANGRIVEVSHKMADKVANWGELCERAGIAPGKTAATSPVTKLMSAGFVNTGNASPCESSQPPCQTGEGCGRGICGMN